MFRTIRQIAQEGIISQHFLRQLVAAGKCPGIQVGNRFMVHREQLVEWLNTTSRQSVEGMADEEK